MIARAAALEYDDLLRDVAESLPLILPSVAVEWTDDVLVCRRGIVATRFEQCGPGEARILFARRDTVEIDARVTVFSASVDDVIADVVGYLIGASLGSLSLYPFQGPKPVLPPRGRRRRRESTWDRERMTRRMRPADDALFATPER